MTTHFIKIFLTIGLLAIAACSVSPAPNQAIEVVPAANGYAAQAIPPTCPAWSGNDLNFFDNQPLPQFGCADARNLALMVDNPEDLLQGRNPGPAIGVTTAGATIRYYNDQTRGLVYIAQQPDFSPDATTAPVANSKLTGETPETSGSSSGSSADH